MTNTPAAGAAVRLKKGRERSLQRRHPWLFAGAVERVDGSPAAGDTVEVFGADGDWLARGAYSPASQLRLRVWTFDSQRAVDDAFFHDRLERAVAARRALALDADTDACRLVNGEADGLPGLIVDRYGDFCVCQFGAAGVERWRDAIVAALTALTGCRGVFDRSDLEVRQKEGLDARSGVLAGDEPPPLIEIGEFDKRFLVDVRRGHKTGFYLDQRDARARLGRYCDGAEVLNCFAYSGGFSVAAAAAGARRVSNVDSSAEALALGRRQLELNRIDDALVDDIEGNVFGVLRGFRAEQRRFDLIILDPPKFVDSRAHLARASRGYKDINWLAFRLLKPGGLLLTFSCSGLLEPALFQKIVADAALDADVDAQIIHRFGQASDHPVLLSFPEGRYLKGLLCRI